MSSENAKKEEPQIERGFNDDELADIMSEIESLEQEFNSEMDFDATSNEDSEAQATENASQVEENEEIVSEVNDDVPLENKEEMKPELKEVKVEEIIEEPVEAKTEDDGSEAAQAKIENLEEASFEEANEEPSVAVKDELGPKENFEPKSDLVKSEILEEFKVEKVEHIKHNPKDELNEEDIHHAKYDLPMKNNFFKSSDELNHSKMSFKVAGDLRMELDFEVGSELISFRIDNNQFKIKLSSGLEMCLPLESDKIKKAS